MKPSRLIPLPGKCFKDSIDRRFPDWYYINRNDDPFFYLMGDPIIKGINREFKKQWALKLPDGKWPEGLLDCAAAHAINGVWDWESEPEIKDDFWKIYCTYTGLTAFALWHGWLCHEKIYFSKNRKPKARPWIRLVLIECLRREVTKSSDEIVFVLLQKHGVKTSRGAVDRERKILNDDLQKMHQEIQAAREEALRNPKKYTTTIVIAPRKMAYLHLNGII